MHKAKYEPAGADLGKIGCGILPDRDGHRAEGFPDSVPIPNDRTGYAGTVCVFVPQAVVRRLHHNCLNSALDTTNFCHKHFFVDRTMTNGTGRSSQSCFPGEIVAQ